MKHLNNIRRDNIRELYIIKNFFLFLLLNNILYKKKNNSIIYNKMYY